MGKIIAAERQKEILKLLHDNGSVKIGQLADYFEVSRETIRRDLSYLTEMPNMTVMAPKNKWELSDMLKYAIAYDAPIALRYPRGEAYDGLAQKREPIVYGKCEEIIAGENVLLFALGSMVKTAVGVCEQLEKQGIHATLVNARFVKPFDEVYLKEHMETYSLIVTMEENVALGGFGEHVACFLQKEGYKGEVLSIAIADTFVEHGNVSILQKELGIDEDGVVRQILEKL